LAAAGLVPLPGNYDEMTGGGGGGGKSLGYKELQSRNFPWGDGAHEAPGNTTDFHGNSIRIFSPMQAHGHNAHN
jgi:hypothetical protein